MSAKISSSGSDVKNSKIAKVDENLKLFSINEHKSFMKFCKQVSEVNFQSKNLQTSDGSNKLGRSNLCLSKIFYVHSVLLVTLKRHIILLRYLKLFTQFNVKWIKYITKHI